MKIKVAPVIHSRTKYVDFRSLLLARPADWNSDDVNTIKNYILSSTSSIEELNKHSCRKLIISDGINVVFGITAYMTYFNDISGNALKNILFDRTGAREIYLFVGLAAKMDDLSCDIAFPGEHYFAEAVVKCLIPRWEEMSHDGNSQNATLTRYDLSIDSDISTDNVFIEINTLNKNKVIVVPHNLENAALESVIHYIIGGNKVSICTNMPVYELKQSLFMNATSEEISAKTVLNNALKQKENHSNHLDDSKEDLYTKKNREVDVVDKGRQTDIHNIVKELVRIGAIVISGAYIIFVDKKTIIGILIASGIGLTALIAEVINLCSRSDITSSDSDTKESRTERGQAYDIAEKKSKSKSDDDIFKI